MPVPCQACTSTPTPRNRMTTRDLRYTGLEPRTLNSGRTVIYGDTITADQLDPAEHKRLAASPFAVPIPSTPKPKRPRRRPTPDTED